MHEYNYRTFIFERPPFITFRRPCTCMAMMSRVIFTVRILVYCHFGFLYSVLGIPLHVIRLGLTLHCTASYMYIIHQCAGNPTACHPLLLSQAVGCTAWLHRIIGFHGSPSQCCRDMVFSRYRLNRDISRYE